MLTDADVALARLANEAYLTQPTGLPAGFVPVSQSALGLNGLAASETYSNGEYTNFNAGAFVSVGTLNGQTTAVLSFRGSVNEQDSINDLRNINNQYALFARLIPAFDAWVARQGIAQVAVTGHSLGGAMAQIYMANHANIGGVSYVSDTFGSPGALITPATDSRITNVRVADDPAVYLGEHRASLGSQLRSDPALAAAAVFAGPEVFPGLTQLDVIGSIGDLNANYVNNGTTAYLPDANGTYNTIGGIVDAANAGKSEHVVTTYLQRIESVTGASGDAQTLPGITPTTIGEQLYRFFDSKDGSHFFTASANERTQLEASRPDLTYEGVGLNATQLPANDPNAAPVFRFFDKLNGSHFFTINAAESNGLMADSATWSYEGVGFYEHATQQAGDTAVYRFFDTSNSTHFYTPSANERATVLASNGKMINEGVAFYTLSA